MHSKRCLIASGKGRVSGFGACCYFRRTRLRSRFASTSAWRSARSAPASATAARVRATSRASSASASAPDFSFAAVTSAARAWFQPIRSQQTSQRHAVWLFRLKLLPHSGVNCCIDSRSPFPFMAQHTSAAKSIATCPWGADRLLFAPWQMLRFLAYK